MPMYRSAFNSEFRNNIRYGTEYRYNTDGSVSKQNEAKCDQNVTGSSEQKYLSRTSLEDEIYDIINSEKDSETNDVDVPKPLPSNYNNYVGFANLPNQIYWKAAKKGFEFTLMVVGSSGLGKSTLINSLFLTNIYDPSTYPGPTARSKQTVTVEATTVTMKEGGVNLTLTLVDTPGFGIAIDNRKAWTPISEFIEDRYEEYFIAESKIDRKPIQDKRVHCCLYFIEPTGHSLKPLDIQFMKVLSDKVNIVPVIAKADTLTTEECVSFKKQILDDIKNNDIKIYNFPDIQAEDDDCDYRYNISLKERVPFAVVGSNTIIEINGRNVKGRKYPWGVIDIENLEHCDFVALKKMIISTHMQDLKDITHNVHYENYRYRKLSMIKVEGHMIKNPLVELEEENSKHQMKLKEIETKMEEEFKQKIMGKEKQLKDTEKLLKMRYEVAKKSLDDEIRELEERRKLFELEKKAWDKEVLCNKHQSFVGSSKESIIEEKKAKKKKGLFG